MTETDPSQKHLKYWRIIATGASFLIFGIGGFVISLCLNIIYLVVPNKNAVFFTRKVISLVFRIYISLLKGLGLLTYDITGKEHLENDSQIVIANHPSLIDVVFLISLLKNANCVVKESLWHTPLTFGPVTVAKYIKSNTQNLIEESQSTLDTGASLVIFPEGTRTTPGKPPKFQRGAANIALGSGRDIVPVLINCTPTTLTKGERWYQVPNKRPHFTIQILPPVTPKDIVTPEIMQSKAARELTRYLEHLLSDEKSKPQTSDTTNKQANLTTSPN